MRWLARQEGIGARIVGIEELGMCGAGCRSDRQKEEQNVIARGRAGEVSHWNRRR